MSYTAIGEDLKPRYYSLNFPYFEECCQQNDEHGEKNQADSKKALCFALYH
jgi:hypothetical protein